MKILVTGGAGYIGSHTCVELIQCGHEVVIIDNFSNSDINAIHGIEKITGVAIADKLYKKDVRDEKVLGEIFSKHKIDCVIHFAGLKAVGESVRIPLDYYNNNIFSTLALCRAMQKYGVKHIVFSSSCTVYGGKNPMPLTESAETGGCTNPYGWSKFMCEQVLRDFAATDGGLSVVLLRYFNPVGAHESGIIGEEPQGIPNNLMPFITQTALGKHEELKIFGNDYDTPDGTCIRDYIHVTDLAGGHVRALDFAVKNDGCHVFNLGTGNGCSVLEMVQTFERVNGLKLPYSFAPRRAGDAPVTYANTEKAREILGFVAEKTIEDMCKDAWNYQKS